MERWERFWVIIDRVYEASYGICTVDWAIFKSSMKGFLELHFAVTVTGNSNENAKPTQRTKVMKSIRSR
jgi:hypothetical protein